MRIVQAKLMGRLGNQLFQYACIKKYAQLHDARFEVNRWIGTEVFGLNDPSWTENLVERNDRFDNSSDAIKWGEVNIRLYGYFQHQPWIDILSKKELQKWFTIQSRWLNLLPKKNTPYTACHLRRGDYVGHPLYCTVSKKSYEKTIEQYSIKNVQWVSEENRLCIPQMDVVGLQSIPDFYKIMNADTILRANSTYSWWAAALSNAKVYSPIVEDLVGENDVPFIEGNHPKPSHSNRVGVPITDLYLKD